jgi:SAM-dependent methyltransferase
MNTKDFFSGHSRIYATFRPVYPQDLYDFVFKHLEHRSSAWDCATGNGQVAQYLAKHFDKVYATDISSEQLANAYLTDNISYSVSPAERTPFDEHQFDLITVGQALHWFDRDAFYQEVRRVGKPGGLLAVWGYSILSVSPEIDPFLMNFYQNIVGPYWDSARKLVDDEYQTITFPFKEIPSPRFYIKVSWTLEHFAGYLETWSATQKFIQKNNTSPVPTLINDLQKYWRAGEEKTVSFPIFLRLGIL